MLCSSRRRSFLLRVDLFLPAGLPRICEAKHGTQKVRKDSPEEQVDEFVKGVQEQQELTTKALQAYVDRNAVPAQTPSPSAASAEQQQLRQRQEFLDTTAHLLTEEQKRRAEEQVKAIATDGFDKLFK